MEMTLWPMARRAGQPGGDGPLPQAPLHRRGLPAPVFSSQYPCNCRAIFIAGGVSRLREGPQDIIELGGGTFQNWLGDVVVRGVSVAHRPVARRRLTHRACLCSVFCAGQAAHAQGAGAVREDRRLAHPQVDGVAGRAGLRAAGRAAVGQATTSVGCYGEPRSDPRVVSR
jgi:hypothetical protein